VQLEVVRVVQREGDHGRGPGVEVVALGCLDVALGRNVAVDLLHQFLHGHPVDALDLVAHGEPAVLYQAVRNVQAAVHEVRAQGKTFRHGHQLVFPEEAAGGGVRALYAGHDLATMPVELGVGGAVGKQRFLALDEFPQVLFRNELEGIGVQFHQLAAQFVQVGAVLLHGEDRGIAVGIVLRDARPAVDAVQLAQGTEVVRIQLQGLFVVGHRKHRIAQYQVGLPDTVVGVGRTRELGGEQLEHRQGFAGLATPEQRIAVHGNVGLLLEGMVLVVLLLEPVIERDAFVDGQLSVLGEYLADGGFPLAHQARIRRGGSALFAPLSVAGANGATERKKSGTKG
jgi:hypothetical protein